ncbi:MAG: cytochrome c biogenesis protein ResB [Treponemataceae bacterium]
MKIKSIKKILKVFHSMQFAIALLIVICLVCTLVSFIPQGNTPTYYQKNYSPLVATLIMFCQLDKAFTSWWFGSLVILLCFNLVLCNIIRFPHIYKQFRKPFEPETIALNDQFFLGEIPLDQKDSFFSKLKCKKILQKENYMYAEKNKISVWGAWLCHCGMLILIVGFMYGTLYSIESIVYGVQGMTLDVAKTPLKITIDKFDIQLRSDFTVNQYISDLTVENTETNVTTSGQSMVNHPLDIFGYTIYQNSTGWANDVKVWYKDELVQHKTVYMGDTFELDDIPITFAFFKFFPDFYDDGHDHGPTSKTPLLINPKTQFAVYYEQKMLDMNYVGMDEDITLDNYKVQLSNPQQYTLLQVRKDPSILVTAFGSFLVIFSLFIAFYFNLTQCVLVIGTDYARIYGRCAKHKKMFADRVEKIISN